MEGSNGRDNTLKRWRNIMNGCGLRTGDGLKVYLEVTRIETYEFPVSLDIWFDGAKI